MVTTIKQRVVYGLVIGCITLALGGIAFAGNEQAKPDKAPCERGMHQMRPDFSQHVNDKLKTLVENNTISQAQADQIAAFLKTRAEERRAEFEKMKGMTPEERKAYREEHRAQRPDMIAGLEENAGLTEEQAKAVAEAIRPHGHFDFARHMTDNLNQLVAQNTISQAQADQIQAFCQQKAEEHKAEFEKVKNMTPEERKAYMDEHKEQREKMFAELKASANLTEEQAKAVVTAIRPPRHFDFAKHVGDKLNNLVEQNTITQAQADQVVAFFQKKGEERRADFEKMKGMTPEERKAYREEHRAQRPDMIAELKANTDLTEEQAKAVAEAIRPPHGPQDPGPDENSDK